MPRLPTGGGAFAFPWTRPAPYGRRVTDEFPRRKAMTRGFRLGAPRTFTISPEGGRVLFVRSDGPCDPVNHLWLARWTGSEWSERRLVDAAALLTGAAEDLPPEERAKRERLREISGGITGYTVADDWSVLAFVLSGQLWLCDPQTGVVSQANGPGGLGNPVMSPDGRRVAATSGPRLVVVDTSDGREQVLLSPEADTVSWGSAEFIAAEEMGRFSGMWWSPDSERLLVTRVDESPVQQWWIADPANPQRAGVPVRYPAAGTPNAHVTLYVVTMAGETTPVVWDREHYEYLARARWDDEGIVLAVQNRPQTSVLTLWVDPDDGSTRVLTSDEHDRWVELVPGVPRLTPAGLAVARQDDDADTRRLVVLGDAGNELAATPDGMQLHAVVASDDESVTFVAADGDPSSCDLWGMTWDGALTRLSDPDGWSSGTAASGTVVVARADLTSPSGTVTITREGTTWPIPSAAESPVLRIEPEFLIDEWGWSNIAVLWPSGGGDQLPIVMSPYGGPHAQRCVRAAGAYATEQWLADQGFCVVVADGPGAPSRLSNEFAIHRDLAGPTLAGQVSALQRVVATYGDRVDPGRVGIRGWSFGGYLSALAVLQRPDVFHVAVAGAPVTDWTLYDTHYTERYLGTPADDPDSYEGSSLIPRASSGSTRPLLLVHGLADDNVVAAHTLRLSSALLAAGVAHTVLPLSGVTHMTPQEIVTENLLRLELQFLQEHLTPTAKRGCRG